MATTTMGNQNTVDRDAMKILYWTLGALALIAILIVASMRIFNDTRLSSESNAPATVEPVEPGSTPNYGTSPDTNGVAPKE
jgi:hypothetical protein